MYNKKILIVEDVQSIRVAIKENLSKEYQVFDVENYHDAVNTLKNENIDLVITDIRMPGKSGLELIQTIKENFPNVLYSLITAYNINDYIHFASEHGVWNILPKYSTLDLNFINAMVYKLLTKDIFGIEKYFKDIVINRKDIDSPYEKPPVNGIIFKSIKTEKERNIKCQKIAKYLKDKGASPIINQLLDEITSNALMRAPEAYKDSILDSKEQSDIQMERPSFEIGYGIYDKTFIIVTKDYYGSLRKEEILKRLDRHITPSIDTGLPEGISDSHGRGLFICREFSDTIVFNIQKNVCTEVIILIEYNEDKKPFKSLSIYEI